MSDLFTKPGPDMPERLSAVAASYNSPLSFDWVPELKSKYGLKLLGEP